MRLLEAIVDANHRALSGDKSAGLRLNEYADSLPLVALTCIDPRLNPLMPGVLGITDEQFIWLRNAGNIIFDSKSSMTRTLALACAIKGGREIAIIGHTDCKVRQTSVLELTERFKALGIERSDLPENLTEFFGLFASERQNVLRGVEFVCNSNLIGRKVPVHGLMVDTESGKLEWVVNGYQALEAAGARAPAPRASLGVVEPIGTFNRLSLGHVGDHADQREIGDRSSPATAPIASIPPISAPALDHAPAISSHREEPREAQPSKKPKLRIDPAAHYKIMDAARKVLGPISGEDLERWVSEGRVDLNTLAQKLGYKDWRPLATFIDKEELPSIPIPPPVAAALRFGIDRKKNRKDRTS